MRQKDNHSTLDIITVIFFVAVAWSISLSARAAGPLDSAPADPATTLVEYEVKPGDTLGGIALANGIALTELMALNGLDDPSRIDAGQILQLPAKAQAGKAPATVVPHQPARAAAPKVEAAYTYEVQPGDTLGGIALANGFSLAELMAANGLDDPGRIDTGQHLHFPSAPRPPKPAEKSVPKNQKIYVVKPGDTLGAIAMAYGVALDELMSANRITDAARLQVGQSLTIPVDRKWGEITKAGVVLELPKGFTLTRVAAAYGVSTKAIIRANRIRNPNRLRAGQRILIPGAKSVIALIAAPPCFKDPVTVYRVLTDVTKKVSLCFCNGRPNPKAVEEISSISGPKGTEVPFGLHPRLAVLLQKVADKFPGQRIEIISGQRTSKQPGRESYHTKGQAIDFRVSGISNKRLSGFIRTFDNVGVGYYPHSVFIHMDTREKSGYWVDYSKPGERAIYGRANMSRKQLAEIRAKRQEAAAEQITAEVEANIDELIDSIALNTKSREN